MLLARRSAQVLISFMLVCLFLHPSSAFQVPLYKGSASMELTSGSASVSASPSGSASVELTSSNFDELVLKSNEIWMVEFFAPWCQHCKRLAPAWKKAANKLEGKVKLGHVDCVAEESLMKRLSVQGFPTILVFGADKDSPIFPYEGARSACELESFALDQLVAGLKKKLEMQPRRLD